MKKTVWIWLFISLIIGGFLSLFASTFPDGYETAGEEIGFIDKAKTIFSSPLPDYTIPGVTGNLSSSLAGIIGVLLTFGMFMLIGRLVGKK